jgi:drug/metabolite transporter (DMT)-like permease
MIGVMSLTQVALACCVLPFVTRPAAAAGPFLAASVAVNVGYMLFLTKAYQPGDLSHVYPLARGIAPLIVAAISVLVLHEPLSQQAKLAVAAIGCGVAGLSLAQHPAGYGDRRAVCLALGTGCFVAVYSVLDGLGARSAGSEHGYVAWLSLATSTAIASLATWFQRNRAAPVLRRTKMVGASAGLISFLGSWVVIWAMTRAPIPLIAALRETSVIFAVAIGALAFGERVNLVRLLSIAITLLGTALLRTAA